MPSDVGLVSKLIETLVGAFLKEDQIPELVKRHKLKAAKEDCRRALIDNDWDRLHAAVERLRDLSSKP